MAAAWLVLDKFGDHVARAANPWGYLWRAVSHICAGEAAEDVLMMRLDRESLKCYRPVVLRVGLHSQLLERPANHHTARPRRTLVACAVRLLVEAGGDRAFWTEAVVRALDVMASSRRSYEACAVRSDPVLRDELGLNPTELSALVALLIGPRRGDRKAQSLLYALCHDTSVKLDGIAKARSRVNTLLARPHTLPAVPATNTTRPTRH
jgi:hypothetical protein